MRSSPEKDSSSVDVLDVIAAAETAAEAKVAKEKTRAAKRARTVRTASVMEDFGQKKAQNLRYSSSEAQVGTPSLSGGNREQRQKTARKARKRR